MDIRTFSASTFTKAVSAQTYAPAATSSGSQTSAKKAAEDPSAQRKLQSAKDTLSRLIKAQKEQREEAKAMAKRKVDELKQRLKMLQQMFSGDPEKLARAIAQIAKELKAAVKAYGGTGASLTDLGGTGGATPQTADTLVDTSGVSAATVEAAETQNSTPPEPETAATDNPDQTQNLTPEQQQAQIEAKEKQAEAQGDSEFVKEVRDLMRKIKALLERAKAEAQTEETQDKAKTSDAQTDEAIEEADKALKSLSYDVNQIDAASQQAAFTTGMVISLTV